MAFTILLDSVTLPEAGMVNLHLNRSFELKVTAEEARHQVKGWLLDQVSYMMTAQSPTLVVGANIVWRVPVILTAVQLGHAGVVGEIDVDVITGAMDASPACKEAILAQARRLATFLPAYQPAVSTPQSWLARDPKPTHPTGKPVGNPLELIPATD